MGEEAKGARRRKESVTKRLCPRDCAQEPVPKQKQGGVLSSFCDSMLVL